uniref:Kunitz/Bovine pancreatic trypsin inhibitor domain protein n=1 Tax=Strongyloides papillosus TaxID=174720 RepID=A0A0N5BXM0_STREA
MGLLRQKSRDSFKKLFYLFTILNFFSTIIFSYDGSNQTYDDYSNYNTYSLNTQSQFSSYPQYTQTSNNNCNLPQQIGTGPYRIPRWYYNPTRQRCELFYWSGCCGNNNNFQSFQSCQTTCEGIISMPTSYLSPMLVQNIVSRPSGYQMPIDQVTNGYQLSTPSYTVTHLTNVPVVTITMPPKRVLNSDPCNQPYSPGYGDQQVPRWFYLPSANTCMKFFYYGKGGDQNNFDSEIMCRNKCIKNNTNRINVNININNGATISPSYKTTSNYKKITTTPTPIIVVTMNNNNQNNNNNNNEISQIQESPNPCANGPSVAVESLTRCTSNNQCNSDQFCHIGGSTQTTICCNKPIIIDICSQPLNIGVGTFNLQRWYYNRNTGQCQSCIYKGLQGNQNNFLTKAACENTCVINPCKSGVPYRVGGNNVQCNVNNQNVCPSGYYCHIGATAQTSVCCQALASSPCTEELAVGEGTYKLERFYFNNNQKKCESFIYRGSKGDSNNFITKQQCESACSYFVNPCLYGEPYMENNLKPKQCTINGSCPNNYYCHYGGLDATTVCCPAKVNSCQGVFTEGEGNDMLKRWYYNSKDRKCYIFNYKGLKGSENNFLTQQSCESSCPVWDNPCLIGEPILAINSLKPIICNPQNKNSCVNTHYCHVGATTNNNVCCQKEGNTPCTLPLNYGCGTSSLKRWYFDENKKTCLPFLYKGSRGNMNNFLSIEDCEIACPVYVDPCPNSKYLSSDKQNYNYCSLSEGCTSGSWCHYGADKETTVCCPNSSDPCKQSYAYQGYGNLKLIRWSYDVKDRMCKQFYYQGLKGNQNNFLSKGECEKKCPVYENPCKKGQPLLINERPVVCSNYNDTICLSNRYCHFGANNINYCCPTLGGDPCNQVMDCGRGSSSLLRWYWNVAQQKCVQFTYLGQKGNQNNFVSQQACESVCYELDNPCAGGNPQMTSSNRPLQCSVTSNTCASNYWCHYGATTTTTVCCPNRVPDSDICSLPMVVGTGRDSLQRWYYDQNTKQCVRFTYTGRYGNQNNFLSQEACQSMCQVYDNVCPSGEPLLDESKTPIPCTFGSDSCGSNHWCHLGTVPGDYQCCPGQPTNPSACQGMAPSVGVLGPTGQPVTRYYYDLETMSCKTFQYLGRKGNANNFISEEDCRNLCNVFNNPCNMNIPLPPTYCTSSSQCSSDQWCHIGATAQTSVCCPSEGNPCLLPLSVGNGNVAITRYYYDSSQFSCQQFTYTGSGGNANNFLTQQQCEQQCAPNPCASGMPYVGADGRAQSCTSSTNINSCPANYWCHIGADATTTVCCPNKQNNVCTLPMSTGEGNAVLERYYFDSASKSCQPFIYKGLKGNENNFLSLRACQLACQQLENPCIGQPATSLTGQILFCSATNKEACPVNFWCHLGATPETTVCCPGATNACSVPLAPGTGDAGLARWYYSTDERACVPFKYNGKRGNQNNFLSEAECNRICPEELCLLTVDSGACNNSTTRYAFDRSTQRCTAFTYSGCGGNANNFESITDCLDTCGRVGFRK